MQILGIRVDEYDMRQSLEKIEAFVAEEGFHQVVTINPEGVWLAKNDPALYAVVEEAALVTADGNGILWAASILGQPLLGRVTGIDLLEESCALAAQKGWRVYLLGGKPGFAARAATALQAKYSGLNIVGTENGYFRAHEAETIAAVAKTQPDLLFAGLGMPYQELWLAEHGPALKAKVAVGVGGCFDVLAGEVKRAPRSWQKLKLEWLWRLLSQPGRLKRQAAIPRYMHAVYQQARAEKKKNKKNNSG